MGGSQSTRKVTIENPDDSIITITEQVVSRLNEAEQTVPPQSSEPAPSTLQVRREVERALVANDARWETRVRSLRSSYDALEADLNDQMKRYLDDFERYRLATMQERRAALVERDNERSDLLECYRKHRGESLHCAEAARRFSEGIRSSASVVS